MNNPSRNIKVSRNFKYHQLNRRQSLVTMKGRKMVWREEWNDSTINHILEIDGDELNIVSNSLIQPMNLVLNFVLFLAPDDPDRHHPLHPQIQTNLNRKKVADVQTLTNSHISFHCPHTL